MLDFVGKPEFHAGADKRASRDQDGTGQHESAGSLSRWRAAKIGTQRCSEQHQDQERQRKQKGARLDFRFMGHVVRDDLRRRLLRSGRFFTGEESPGTKEPPAKIVTYYVTHESEVKTSALLFALAFLVLVLFAASLRSYFRRTPAAEGPSALVLAGAVLIAAGALISSGVEFGLANEIQHLGPQSVQTLNFITEEVAFLPVVGGAFLLAI